MAIGTQQLQVGEAVVGPIAVDVVQLKGQRLSTPLAKAAGLASPVLETVGDQPELEIAAVGASAGDEEILERLGSRSWCNGAASHRISPGIASESESMLTIPGRMASLVVGANFIPVVAPGQPRLWRVTELAHVEAHRRPGDSERAGNLSLR